MKRIANASMLSNVAISLALLAASVGLTWSLGTEAEAGEPANQSIGGKPFRVSESVKKYCAADPKIMMCAQAMPLLAAMLEEPRDPQWAARVEALIEKSMRVGGKQWIQIRALECRSIHCALEYAVYVNDLDHDVDGSEELERLMDPLTGIVIPEMNSASGKPMMVSVLVWQKRQNN